MMKYYSIAMSFMLMALGSTAQSQGEALRFSTYDFGGSARYNAMAGAFGALGGDMSVISTNPAGLGVYRSSDLMISPTFQVNTTDASYNGATTDDARFNFNFNNLGLLIAYDTREGSKWKKAQFAFTYNRLQDFQNNVTIGGENESNTFLSPIVDGLNAGDFVDPQDLENGNFGFVEFPAYQTYLIDAIDGIYVPTVPDGTRMDQLTDLQTRGRISESSIAGSANYDERLFIGASMAFQRIIHEQTTFHKEEVLEDIPNEPIIGAALDEFTFTENIDTRGNGFNLKLGAIFKANEMVRIGAAYQSPTWSTLTMNASTEMTSLFENGESFEQSSPQGALISYNLASPSRMTGSLGLVLGKKAILSADYEYLDYASVRLRSSRETPGIDFREANALSQEIHDQVANVRIGGEYRLQPFSIRLGAAIYGNPYKDEFVENSNQRMIYTGGIGYRVENTYVDFSYKFRRYASDYYMYDPDYVPLASLEHRDHSVSVSLGVRF